MSEIKTNKISSLASNNDITIDPDGTGNTIIASGFVGIGTTSPPDHLSVVTSGSNAQLSVDRSDGGAGRTVLIHSSTGGQLQTTGSVPLIFGTADTERMRIHSNGDFSVSKVGFQVDGRNSNASNNASMFYGGTFLSVASYQDTAMLLNRMGNNGSVISFRQAANTVGTISVTGSGTSYNTSSDYRLKENVTYDWDATTRLKQLKPARFNFIVDADTTVDGFLAHEAQAVVSEAVTGTKDAVDADGNPEYQGIDQAKLVPLLVKTIQELEARITALEAE